MASRLSGLARKIHRQTPLPLTPRQSAQLGKSLTDSFDQQLDKEHGDEKSTSSHTNAHFASLLGHPHFAPRSKPRAATHPTTPAQSSQKSQSLQDLQSAVMQPVEKFERQIAIGEATFQSALSCMQQYRLLRGVGVHGAGRQPAQAILGWLYSTGLEESLEFLHHKDFLVTLIEQLYVEAKEAALLGWQKRLVSLLSTSGGSPLAQEDIKATRSLVYAQVKAKGAIHGLESALQVFHELLVGFAAEIGPELHNVECMKYGGTYIRKLLAAHDRAQDVSAESFDLFVSDMPLWVPLRLQQPWRARLALHHPTLPEAGPALAHLRSSERQKWLEMNPIEAFKKLQNCIALSRRAASLLSLQGRQTEAREANEFAERFTTQFERTVDAAPSYWRENRDHYVLPLKDSFLELDHLPAHG